ncbi:MAG TPA: adenylyl-sulfate kinase, partial [Actinomycetota bacterium]|nr:adenylyl-sulfate kinase [Actinomycetota bacterium]
MWLTGLSGSGKSTIAEAFVEQLQRRGVRWELLDGDVVRTNLSKGLGFSKEDRDTNILRIGWVAERLAYHGAAVVVSAISPYRAIRDQIRSQIPRFVEVFVSASVEECARRD